ncbi:outer membrane protein assembly factor BamE [Nitrosomonas sp. JL21]|uniref:outer membrane protein assembly factor BamE n=1 Tax=Nitrosomonas sp. JL21 TaxID=153949 RepID=UPI0013717B15|nr:outer membrane protein assembly factor BamE [Nitrosomonas sp. JL21]MBL8497908.1 outer membrane protein assembly factor BamE [Nitrosomonas sp.]MCC7092199.1 outer membrane protein assembly factor BamE [Nitrosomonas sp.]MXS78251.1 outer membrane protein assembly factor BamE [Nitrosomonas sp. JL21]
MIAKTLVLTVLLFLTGCSYLPPILYKIDVQQGNVITEEMLDKLKPGMTKSQVLFVLGSPLIVDTFRDNRWDYVYIFREKGNLVEQKRLTVFFENDKIVHIENHLTFSKNPTTAQPAAANSKTEPAQVDTATTK